MDGIFRRPSFLDFGPCPLDPPDLKRPTLTIDGKKPSALRAAIRRNCPRLPGVYGMINRTGELIYVGKAKLLRTRLLGYFLRGNRRQKPGRIVREAVRITWEIAPNEFSALLRELELIRRFQPRLNVQGQPQRLRRAYLCLGRRPAPHAFAACKPPRSAELCFGPFPGLLRTQQAARVLNDLFQLRDCPQQQKMDFGNQSELFPIIRPAGCLRLDIGHCSGPCAGRCTREDYERQFQSLVAFLRDEDISPLEDLQNQERQAAGELLFERAAILNERVQSLLWLRHHLARLRQALSQSFIYPVRNHDGQESHILIHHGSVQAVLTPGDLLSPTTALNRLDVAFQKPIDCDVPFTQGIDVVLLVASWFRRFPGERERVWEVSAYRKALARGKRRPSRPSVTDSEPKPSKRRA
ncbi:MAG: GIY-YIG nuclease family protein [Gemmataceae bacterium]